MSALAAPLAPVSSPALRYRNGTEWLDALGGVSLDRVVFDPWPGTATEADVLRHVDGDDKRLVELVNGTLVEKPLGYWEGVIGGHAGRHLGNFAYPRALGLITGADSTMRMSAGNIRLPDVGFTVAARVPKTRAKVPATSPDLVVEVLSASNTRAEMQLKLREYFATGTRLAWYVDPETRTVAVHHAPGEPTRVLAESDALDGEDVLPGFALPVAELFAGVPR